MTTQTTPQVISPVQTLTEYYKAMYPLLKVSPRQETIDHFGLGLSGELGELSDALKQHIYGKPLDPVNIIEELGDLLWYVVVSLSLHDEAEAESLLKAWPEHATLGPHPDVEVTPTDYSKLVAPYRAVHFTVNRLAGYLIEYPVNHELHSRTLGGRQVDALYWVVKMAAHLGVWPELLMQTNVAKLHTRYHKEFELYKSEGRKKELERQQIVETLANAGILWVLEKN